MNRKQELRSQLKDESKESLLAWLIEAIVTVEVAVKTLKENNLTRALTEQLIQEAAKGNPKLKFADYVAGTPLQIEYNPDTQQWDWKWNTIVEQFGNAPTEMLAVRRAIEQIGHYLDENQPID